MMWSTAARRCFSVYNIRIKFINKWSTILCDNSDRHTDIRTEERTHTRTDGGTNGRHGRTDARTDRRHGHYLGQVHVHTHKACTWNSPLLMRQLCDDPSTTDMTDRLRDRNRLTDRYILTRRARGTRRC